jgi:hypothetical protein
MTWRKIRSTSSGCWPSYRTDNWETRPLATGSQPWTVRTFNIEEFNIYIFFFLGGGGATAPQWARASSFTRFLDHAQRRPTVGRTPLDEWSALCRDLYLTTNDTHNRHPSPLWDSDPQCLAGERTADLRLRPRGHWDQLKNSILEI